MNEWIGRVQVVWEGLQPRERILVGVAAGGLALTLLVIGIVFPIQSATARATEAANRAGEGDRQPEGAGGRQAVTAWRREDGAQSCTLGISGVGTRGVGIRQQPCWAVDVAASSD